MLWHDVTTAVSTIQRLSMYAMIKGIMFWWRQKVENHVIINILLLILCYCYHWIRNENTFIQSMIFIIKPSLPKFGKRGWGPPCPSPSYAHVFITVHHLLISSRSGLHVCPASSSIRAQFSFRAPDCGLHGMHFRGFEFRCHLCNRPRGTF